MISFIRIKKEIEICKKIPLVIDINFCEDCMYKVNLIIKPNTEIFKREYTFLLLFSEEYPFKPPEVFCKTKVYHPNIDGDIICLGILSNWLGNNSIKNIIEDILSLFISPNLSDPMNLKAMNDWGNKNYNENL